jgi:hypothetical protein
MIYNLLRKIWWAAVGNEMTAMLLNLPGGIWQNHENFKQNTV